MSENKYLSDEKYSFCLVEVFVEGKWVPMGIKNSTISENDYDSANSLSDELREKGRITCVVPTENWSFVTLDTSAYAIKISPFSQGFKDTKYIEKQFLELTKMD